ncbi:MAG: Dabb family protein [Chloroflexi bacterium]|nr:Dabb family protein [Chloroflexota bacterium]
MIRHVIMVKFKPDAPAGGLRFLHNFWEESRTRYRGMLGLTYGPDAGLRDGNWTTLAVFDFADEASFRAFDADAYHNEVRAQLPANGVEQAVRCQIRL